MEIVGVPTACLSVLLIEAGGGRDGGRNASRVSCQVGIVPHLGPGHPLCIFPRRLLIRWQLQSRILLSQECSTSRTSKRSVCFMRKKKSLCIRYLQLKRRQVWPCLHPRPSLRYGLQQTGQWLQLRQEWWRCARWLSLLPPGSQLHHSFPPASGQPSARLPREPRRWLLHPGPLLHLRPANLNIRWLIHLMC